ncbi:MAG: hypothetical protein KKH75_00660 [Actinobacteria bacterium]|nr:hypothetical protein [Actinomycetota bacterium]
MTAETRPPRTSHLATLAVDIAVTKLDGLAVVALSTDSPVRDAGTSRPYIRLTADTWAEIDIPKFGEPPPLSIDVYSATSIDDARRQALLLATELHTEAGWIATPMFAV